MTVTEGRRFRETEAFSKLAEERDWRLAWKLQKLNSTPAVVICNHPLLQYLQSFFGLSG